MICHPPRLLSFDEISAKTCSSLAELIDSGLIHGHRLLGQGCCLTVDLVHSTDLLIERENLVDLGVLCLKRLICCLSTHAKLSVAFSTPRNFIADLLDSDLPSEAFVAEYVIAW